eukprot:TRINITY_DN111622_c0_g1_i1.p1 TRINITY_DN111622_c0_g1~~TRINITY_DN111622_c0_g1_i1.p1  ORF type:complete len:715 (+),score=122.05 TRINITY_DN111622_c0_g1_i1:93-2147(+)
MEAAGAVQLSLKHLHDAFPGKAWRGQSAKIAALEIGCQRSRSVTAVLGISRQSVVHAGGICILLTARLKRKRTNTRWLDGSRMRRRCQFSEADVACADDAANLSDAFAAAAAEAQALAQAPLWPLSVRGLQAKLNRKEKKPTAPPKASGRSGAAKKHESVPEAVDQSAANDDESVVEAVESDEACGPEPEALVSQEMALNAALWQAAADVQTDLQSEGEPSLTGIIEALVRRGHTKALWEGRSLGAQPLDRRHVPNPRGEQVDDLAYGLENVVRLDGALVPLSLLPEAHRRELRTVPDADALDDRALPEFIPPFRDTCLRELALRNDCKFLSSTSSLTGPLGKCYFALSSHFAVDARGLSQSFKGRSRHHTPGSRFADVSYLRRTECGRAWSLSQAPEADEETVLMFLGNFMEYQVKMSKTDFDSLFMLKPEAGTDASEDAGNAHAPLEADPRNYRFLKMGDFLMRSQLDGRLDDKIFDIKTRAVAPVRYNMENYRDVRSYRIKKARGASQSFELEIYDMMRSAFLKYGFQARIGRMDGILCVYHNTAEVFGYQYFRLSDMDRCVYGSEESADAAFDLSTKLLQEVLGLVTDDPALNSTGCIKLRLNCDIDSCNGRGNALDVSAAAVRKEGSPAEEELGPVKRWRIVVTLQDEAGKEHPASKALSWGLSPVLDALEIHVPMPPS